MLLLTFSTTLFLLVHLLRLVTYGFAIGEEPLGWRIVAANPETWNDRGTATCCPFLSPAIEIGAPDAHGFVPLTVREVKFCAPWEANDVLARLTWLPDASGELESYFAQAKREHPDAWRAIGVAPHDSLKHAELITFLDAALEAGIEGLVFVDLDDHSVGTSE